MEKVKVHKEEVEGGSQNRQRQMKVFSSPYKARVVMEKVKVHKEEVNLDSGKEIKWLEVQERELIDLTGDVMEDGSDLSTHKDINDIKKIVSSPKDVDLQSSESISSSPNHLEKRKLVSDGDDEPVNKNSDKEEEKVNIIKSGNRKRFQGKS